jgi:trehalose synthase
MTGLLEVPLTSQPIDRLAPLAGQEQVDALREKADRARTILKGRVLWNVNSTAHGGGVAEMLHSLMPYVRGLDVNTRWVVLQGNEDFFHVTKRLHHALHGSTGDGSELGDRQRAVYEEVTRANAAMLHGVISQGDVVILHDPQTAGLVPHLVAAGALVIWRCHVGADEPGSEVDRGWAFLEPYIEKAHATIFSREQYIPPCCDHGRAVVIPPSIDPFSPKNQEMSRDTAHSILVHTGIIEGPPSGPPVYTRQDGSPGRVDRQADMVRLGRAPDWETPLVVQVSRWDPLKDPIGVIDGFIRLLEAPTSSDVHLVLAGPNVSAVSDDPEGKATLDAVEAAWRELPHGFRHRVHLACLPMADDEENAAIVNALQRHAAIVVQKSIKEGFGLTVTEAMWKARPVIASAVGGIRDQVTDGVHGVLLDDPRDTAALATAIQGLLDDTERGQRLGAKAHERVREQYLGTRHLLQYADLLERLAGG